MPTRTIYKYPVKTDGPTKIPWGATIQGFGIQNHQPMVWAVVTLGKEMRVSGRKLKVLATGERMEENFQYLKTCFDGPYVWHLVEVV